MGLSVQYQRSRSSTASATKNIGMPLTSASSTGGGRSKTTFADSSRPSSLRSNRSCVISAVSAAAPAENTKSTAATRHASQRSGTRKLLQHGVEESVVVTNGIVPDARGHCLRTGQQMPGRGPRNRLFVVRKKRLDLMLAFGAEHGTRAVHEAPTGREQRPQRPEQTGLQPGQLRDVGLAPEPSHVGVTPHDSGSGAWRVEQDRVERLPVPP